MAIFINLMNNVKPTQLHFTNSKCYFMELTVKDPTNPRKQTFY